MLPKFNMTATIAEVVSAELLHVMYNAFFGCHTFYDVIHLFA